MKRRSLIFVVAAGTFLTIATVRVTAQEHSSKHHHYMLIDVGTFGGPSSWIFNPGLVRLGLLNNQGTLAGSADTSAADPDCFWAGCYATNAFQWKNGVMTDLGVLPGGIGSQVNWISANGLMVGIADNGQPDPLNPGLPQVHAVVWQGGIMTDLGTFAGGYDTWATSVNSRGEIVGEAYNTTPDPDSMFGYGYQSRAFYWNNGVVQDLGTLGTGNDAAAGLINERGQVIGVSYTSSTPDAFCTIYGWTPSFTFTTGAFLWDRKNGMKDIGGLGGACTIANDLNNQGQIIGVASVPGDTQAHPFVWNAATGMTDLLDPSDTSFGYAYGENAQGEITGQICNAVICNAVLWRKRGGHWEKTILGTTAQISFGFSINASEQVVGALWLTNGTAAFLAEGGGPVVDLNTLIPAGSGLQLTEADQINDLGEIAAEGPDANGNNHVVLLIPCDDDHPGVEGCDYSMADASITVQTTPAVRDTSTSTLSHSLMRGSNRYRFPSLGAPRPN